MDKIKDEHADIMKKIERFKEILDNEDLRLDLLEEDLHEIKENTFNKFDLISVHIYHSLGIVKKGEICLFVFASSDHRKNAQKAIEFLVEQIKSKTPIFGKEHFSDQTHQWKVNK